MRTVATAVVATAVWVTTWVLPVTFMLAMAWGCESHARSLGRRALEFYAGEARGVQAAAASAEARRGVRRTIRGVLLALSIAVPIAFVAYVDHVRNTVGINWLGALGALVAVSLVGAVSVAAARR